MPESPSASILLPDFPAAAPLPGAALFGIDDRAYPGRVRLDIELDGVRAEDGKLHAVYLGSAS
jgi:hypothetical protein